MAASQIGVALDVGAGTITGSYIVQSAEDGGKAVEDTRINDEDGALKTIVVKQKHPIQVLDLICISGAAPETDFPKGSLAAHLDFSGWLVTDFTATRQADPRTVSVTLEDISITTEA